jgi:tetratricopeptide (TPR) repeat protein
MTVRGLRYFVTIGCIALLLPLGTEALAQSAVNMKEETVLLPTYLTGESDPNPIFYDGRSYQGARGPIYPYPLMDNLTDTKADKPYKSLSLENEYIQMTVLPEIGGRIFTALDKTNNYDFFYRQHVIKPALVGMLGAWISGGVEWNIPHHHRATSFMPVDYRLVENSDGSRTIWVGEIELRHRMRWEIGLTVYPGKSYIEAAVRLYNRTPLVNSFLYWANPAVYVNPEYQVIFPPDTNIVTFHAKDQFSYWPFSTSIFNGVDYTRGVDISWWKDHPNPISFFAWGSEMNFHAGYDHGKRAGVVEVGNHNIVVGKKFWEWGNGPEGRLWDRILTDTDGPYIELMVGAYSDNQPDYSWIQPYEVKSFKQYWYPIRDIGGVKNATREAAVNLDVEDGKTVKLGFNATSAYPDARALLQAGDRTLLDQKVMIGPAKPFVTSLALPPGAGADDLKASLWSSDGKELVSYTPVRKERPPLPDPVEAPPLPEQIKSNDELYFTGLRIMQMHDPAHEPYPYFEEGLKRDPGDFRCNTALGILYCKRGMYREAEKKLRRAVARSTPGYTMPKDGGAFYYLGVALRAQGKEGPASDAFNKAAWSLAWSGASDYALAELSARKGDFAEALGLVERSIAANGWNTEALDLKAALLRRLGRAEEALTTAHMVESASPLDFRAPNEVYLAETALGQEAEAEKTLMALSERMRGAAPSYLELAVGYGNAGLFAEAAGVLARLANADSTAGLDPLVPYTLAFYLEKAGETEKARKFYQLASRLSSDFCFPFQLELVEVLHRAMEVDPVDARAALYLGNLLYDRQPDAATSAWEKAATLDPKLAVVHRNLGFAYSHHQNDLPKAIKSLETAISIDNRDPRYFLEIDQLNEANGLSPQERYALLDGNRETVLKRDDAAVRLLSLYVRLGYYDQAIDLMSKRHFRIWEGGTDVHELYVDAYLLRGSRYLAAKKYPAALADFRAALEYPANLDVATPDHIENPRADYLIGKTLEAMGKPSEAKAAYEHAAAAKQTSSEALYYQALALQEEGNSGEATRIFETLVTTRPPQVRNSEPSNEAAFEVAMTERKRLAEEHYRTGLGYLGKGSTTEAQAEFQKALSLDPAHIGASAIAKP